MAKYPEFDSVGMINPVTVEIEHKTLLSRFEGLGKEKRRKKWLYPRRNLTFRYRLLQKADGETLWEFYIARGGTYEAFSCFVPEPKQTYRTYTGEYVGTGDGSTTIFNLPAKTSSSYTVYVDGNSQTGGGVDYTFSAGGGPDGEDKITFTAAPNDGVRITYDFTGVLKVRSRFAEDMQGFDFFFDRLVTTGIKLKGLLNDE
jgi:hypothetical protein